MSFIVDTFFGGAERKAGKAEVAGITEGIEEQRRQFDLTREDFAPGIEAGDVSRERLLEFLGIRGPEAEQRALSGFTESPGQAFLRERGIRQANRAASVSGGLGGGNILEELNRQGIGFAGQFLGERKDRLAGLAGQGLRQVGQQGVIGANISGNISGLLGQRGQARASGILGQAAGIRRGLSGVAKAFIGAGGGAGGATLANTPSLLGSGGGSFGLTRSFGV